MWYSVYQVSTSMKITCLSRSLPVFLADRLYFRADPRAHSRLQHTDISPPGKRADGRFLAACEYSLLAYGIQGWCYFSAQFGPPSDRVPHLAGAVSAKRRQTKMTYCMQIRAPTFQQCVLFFNMWMDINHLLNPSTRAGLLRFFFILT